VKGNFERVFGGTAKSGYLAKVLAGNRTPEISFLMGLYAALHCNPSQKALTPDELQNSFVQTDRNELKNGWYIGWKES